jgi:hypothetical protein
MQVDRYTEIGLPVELSGGESLVCDGTATVRIYDAAGRPKARYRLAALPPIVAPGAHTITLDSDFGGDESPRVEVQFKGLGPMEAIRAHR